jgi:predicted helicase
VYVFPLLVDQKPNFSPEFTKWAVNQFGQIDPMLLFGYIYSILYSQKYRSKYNSDLRTSYPRIPITANKELFLKMSSIGNDLIDFEKLEAIL